MSGFKIGDLVHYDTRGNPIQRGLLGIIVGWTTEEAEFQDGWVSCARVYWTSRGDTAIVELDDLELARQ